MDLPVSIGPPMHITSVLQCRGNSMRRRSVSQFRASASNDQPSSKFGIWHCVGLARRGRRFATKLHDCLEAKPR
jgi:hypothetical protein